MGFLPYQLVQDFWTINSTNQQVGFGTCSPLGPNRPFEFCGSLNMNHKKWNMDIFCGDFFILYHGKWLLSHHLGECFFQVFSQHFWQIQVCGWVVDLFILYHGTSTTYKSYRHLPPTSYGPLLPASGAPVSAASVPRGRTYTPWIPSERFRILRKTAYMDVSENSGFFPPNHPF